MSENDCKNCIHAKNLNEKIKEIKEEMKEHREDYAALENRVSTVERERGEDGVRMKMLFQTLDKIEKAVDKIASKMESLESADAKAYKGLKTKIFSTAITTVIATIIGAILGLIMTVK